MSKTIWKYPIPIADEFTLEMPESATVLTVQIQYREPQLWALVDPKAPKVMRSFCIRGTGHEFNDEEGRYIGTYQQWDGRLVLHLFEMSHAVVLATP